MSKVDVKVVLLGRHSVGKTCLVERYLHGKFKDNTVATVGAAFGAKKMDVSGKEVTLGIWDTAGQERYESMSRIYYRSAKAALVCFDLTDSKSFDKVRFWVDELMANEEGCAIYIVGTKLDALGNGGSRIPDDVSNYADRIGAKVYETSAKTGAGIDELFTDIALRYVGGAPHFSRESARVSPVNPPPPQKKSNGGGCCS